jgi:hypothetical protein
VNKLKLSVEDVKQGVERYYGRDWLFKLLSGAIWENSFKAARIVIDGIEINIFEGTNVIRMGLWYSRTAHIDTYIGDIEAIDIEIARLFEQLHNETNYVYEREQSATARRIK